jgi:hypothetical protein
VHKFCKAQENNTELAEAIAKISSLNTQWGELTMQVGTKAGESLEEIGAASVDYLMFSGYVVLAYTWARMAVVAQQKLAEGTSEEAFYKAKIITADFYFKRLLPRAGAHFEAAQAGMASVMDLPEDSFIF